MAGWWAVFFLAGLWVMVFFECATGAGAGDGATPRSAEVPTAVWVDWVVTAAPLCVVTPAGGVTGAGGRRHGLGGGEGGDQGNGERRNMA